jgi:hypothetical protein
MMCTGWRDGPSVLQTEVPLYTASAAYVMISPSLTWEGAETVTGKGQGDLGSGGIGVYSQRYI